MYISHRESHPCINVKPKSQTKVEKAQQKINFLYLVDSIVKNVGGSYVKLFQKNIVKMFEDTFEVAVSSAILRLL